MKLSGFLSFNIPAILLYAIFKEIWILLLVLIFDIILLLLPSFAKYASSLIVSWNKFLINAVLGLVLAVFYFLILMPVAVFARLYYWTKQEPTNPNSTFVVSNHQFKKSDFLNPW